MTGLEFLVASLQNLHDVAASRSLHLEYVHWLIFYRPHVCLGFKARREAHFRAVERVMAEEAKRQARLDGRD